jgi:hypothetical protein
MVHQLLIKLGPDAASRCAAALFLHPQLWQPAYISRGPYYYAHSRGHVQAQLLQAGRRGPSAQLLAADWILRLSRRVLALRLTPGAMTQPNLATCVGYLLAADHGLTAELLDALSLGDWSAAWDRPERLADSAPRSAAHALQAHWQEQGAQYAITLLRRFYRQDRLNERAFRHILEAMPSHQQGAAADERHGHRRRHHSGADHAAPAGGLARRWPRIRGGGTPADRYYHRNTAPKGAAHNPTRLCAAPQPTSGIRPTTTQLLPRRSVSQVVW